MTTIITTTGNNTATLVADRGITSDLIHPDMPKIVQQDSWLIGVAGNARSSAHGGGNGAIGADRAELQIELNRLQRELGKTIVFVTHDIDEAFILADQVVIFRKGGIIAQAGTPAEILADPADEFVATL